MMILMLRRWFRNRRLSAISPRRVDRIGSPHRACERLFPIDGRGSGGAARGDETKVVCDTRTGGHRARGGGGARGVHGPIIALPEQGLAGGDLHGGRGAQRRAILGRQRPVLGDTHPYRHRADRLGRQVPCEH